MTTQKAVHRALPDNAETWLHKFSIGGHEGVIFVSLYDDRTPGEIRIQVLREGGLVQGLLNAMCLALSLVLQCGAPTKHIMSQFKGMNFEPAGFTTNTRIPLAKSIPDYFAQWFEHQFPSCHDCGSVMIRGETQVRCPSCGVDSTSAQTAVVEVPQPDHQEVRRVVPDTPPCLECGSTMVREDNMYRCANCGMTADLG